jgi:hypothetical protein
MWNKPPQEIEFRCLPSDIFQRDHENEFDFARLLKELKLGK